MISGYLNQISGYEIRYQDILFLEQAQKLGYPDTRFKYPDIAYVKVRNNSYKHLFFVGNIS